MFMLFWFSLSILVKSSDYIINFTESDYDLFLNSSGVFIRRLYENKEVQNLVCNSTNVKDFSVNLSISLYFDESKEHHLLNIVVDPMKVNLNLKIECLNGKNLYPGIFVHDKSNTDNDYYNYYTITIHSDTIFYYDMTDWRIGTIEAYSSKNQLLTRVSLSEEKFFYDSYSYICYKSANCLQEFEIGPYDSYFIATDDTMLNLFINDVYLNEYDQSFYILFDKQSDFPKINERIVDKNVHLMGISSKSPIQLNIDNEINIAQLTLSNIRLVKKKPEEVLNLNFDTISIYDETKDVFPTSDCTITCNNFYEYRTNNEVSRFKSITVNEKGCFYISPDFDLNGDILLNIKNDVIEVKSLENDELLATVPVVSSYSKTEIHIEYEKNFNHHKIVIKNNFANLEDNLDELFGIYFESCGQIPIEFVDWNEEKLSGFLFSINNDLCYIYEEFITNINSPYLKYKYNIDEENYFSFPEDSTNVVLCLLSDECSQPELAVNHVYQHPINGEDINALLSDYFKQNANIEKLSLVLNDNFKDKELSLPSSIQNLKFISFIYNGKTEPLPFVLSSFPSNQIDMEIIKCSITTKPSDVQVKIGQLFVSENGKIQGDGVTIGTTINEKNIDISNKDVTIQLSGNDKMKLIIKSGKNPHKIVFESSDENNFDCLIYIQALDHNYNDIPISFVESTKQTESSNKLQIIIINNERIIFTSIPTNIETIVKGEEDDNEIVRYYIPPKSANCLQDKVSICYNNNLCERSNDEDEMHFSSATEKDFASLIELLMKDDTKIYEHIRLIFQNNMDYEYVNFRQIPASQTKQIQLTSYGEIGESYLILNEEIENENIKSWLFEPKVFLWRKNDDRFFYFNEISTQNADESHILEILDNIYDNYYIEIFHIPPENVSIYNYLVDSNLIDNFGKIFIEMKASANGDYKIECAENDITLNDDDYAIQNPDFSCLYLSILDNGAQSQTIKINRIDKTINQANLIINKKVGSVTIDFECKEESINKSFELDLYMMNNETNIIINQNSCKSINYYKIPYTINDVPDLSEINETDDDSYNISYSNEFEFTSSGYNSKENGIEKYNDIGSTINKILFIQNIITISEADDCIQSSTPVYFVPYHSQSRIIIKESVTNSNIGVTSDKSPRVVLEKNKNPLSFMNNLIDGGFIEIQFDQDFEDLYFNEVNNNQGPFHLDVPNLINNVNFNDIKMSQESSFEIKHKEETKRNVKRIKSEVVGPIIKVSNSVIISPESNSTIRNLELNGELNIHDDSTLHLAGKTNFLNESKIKLIIDQSNPTNKDDRSLIQCDENLDTIPSSIDVSIVKNGDEKVDISDRQIIGPFDLLDLCNELRDQINFENEKDYSFSHNCIEKESNVYLTFSVKEKSNKLGAGAIAGIVIACVVVVALLIGLIVFCVKRKKNIELPSTEGENDDYSCNY